MTIHLPNYALPDMAAGCAQTLCGKLAIIGDLDDWWDPDFMAVGAYEEWLEGEESSDDLCNDYEFERRLHAQKIALGRVDCVDCVRASIDLTLAVTSWLRERGRVYAKHWPQLADSASGAEKLRSYVEAWWLRTYGRPLTYNASDTVEQARGRAMLELSQRV